MVETANAPVENVEVNADGTVAAQEPEAAKKSRIVLATDEAIAEYRARDKNQSINSNVHPNLYADIVAWARDNNDTDGKPYKIVDNNVTQLQDGTLAEVVRRALAQFVNYTGDLVIPRERRGNAQELQANAFRSAAKLVFINTRQMIQMMGLDESQGKEHAYALVKQNAKLIAPDLIVTDDMLAEMWASPEAA